jgi:hypothetical protein
MLLFSGDYQRVALMDLRDLYRITIALASSHVSPIAVGYRFSKVVASQFGIAAFWNNLPKLVSLNASGFV